MHGQAALPDYREIRHFHLFAGLGGGARGFNRGTALVGNMQAVFRCIGGIDVPPDAATAIADTMGKTLLLAWSGESFMLSALPIWVQQIGIAMSLNQPETT